MLGQLGIVGVVVILIVGCLAAVNVVLMLLGFRLTQHFVRFPPRDPPHLRPAPLSRRKMLGVGGAAVLTFASASLVGIFVKDTITTALLIVVILLPLTVFLWRARKPGPPLDE